MPVRTHDDPEHEDRQPRLHPQSWHELRQLVKLHGARDLRRAIDKIESEANATPERR
jgi:hypothetical protein